MKSSFRVGLKPRFLIENCNAALSHGGQNSSGVRTNSTSAATVTVYGGYGSPYTRKVEAALRYKRVPFIRKDLMPGNVTGDWDKFGLSAIKAKVIPVVRFPDGTVKNDSTPLLQDLDERYPERKILPENKGSRFLSLLLEDMFDEWGTKVMFGKRWQTPYDVKWTGEWIAMDFMMGKGTPLDQVRAFGQKFAERQSSRMHLVGCKDHDLVNRSCDYFASTLEDHLAKGSMFLTGASPTVADFALYGQLAELLVDSTPDRYIREKYPAVWAWIRKCEDLSGEEGEAHFEDQEAVLGYLRFAGTTYLPFLQANREAIQKGEQDVQVTVMGDLVHKQPVFKYQQKCLAVLQAEYSRLEAEDAERVGDLLKQTNCHQFLASQ